MNTRTTYALLAILATVGTLSVAPAVFAQGYFDEESCPDCDGMDNRQKAMASADNEIPITVKTDKKTYNHESTINVSGTVAYYKTGVPVTITVVSPSNNIVTVQQIDVNQDRTFKTALNTAGSLWKYDGTYVIRAQYGSQDINNRVLVELTDGVSKSTQPPKECTASELNASGSCIPFTISTGSVTSASINTASKSLVIMIESVNDGTLTLTPSQEIISGVHTILVDGEQWDDVTINSNEITIMFLGGAEKIEIFGAKVIPEFGAIAALILAVAIISIIAVSARSRLSIMPKY